jgi:hypothetical protein
MATQATHIIAYCCENSHRKEKGCLRKPKLRKREQMFINEDIRASVQIFPSATINRI